MKFSLSKLMFLTLIISILVYTSCKDTKERKVIEKSKIELPEITKKSSDISKINFYFENSASMNGYLDGKNFKQVMHRILGNIDPELLSAFFVNTKEHQTTDIINRIGKKQIGIGDISNSDHQFIFSNAIDHAINNNLSIVVTDGIYSVKDGDIDIVEIDIENAFIQALKQNEIETVILKLTSGFNGIYYSESCNPGHKAISINQKRPYYIFLFGNPAIINKALKDIVDIEDLPGFKNKARFFINKNKDLHYSILTAGEEKHGTFKPDKRGGKGEIHTIVDAARFSRGMFSSTKNEDNYLGFGIAIDLKNLPLPESYITNINNYKVDDETGYKVVEIKKISDLSKSSQTYKMKKDIDKKYTHIIIVNAKNKLFGDLDINLEIKTPSWINDTGIDNDCNIKENELQTFAFDKLINGISKAYEKVNNTDEYFEINLKIKP